ncbi:flagellar basal-body rod protein FlgB [Desulfocucumis palustris]|uniref:Flagellar basal body rod protein FlgB n=1 Tax=Desulfocucumis palustris TaxID=1898651 RepID=A0A2L2XAG2_9FIRM|nr:flagellar basal body rod protein FlgB [Desulfocucumis palustris]GBF33185.1 flagellar basal-body rod protein FlgB [Desulfocucumis palustris]
MDLFANPVLLSLSRQLDASALTHRVIANNVANVNTPGFKKSYVSFQEQLKAALGKQEIVMLTTSDRHMGGIPSLASVSPVVIQEKGTTMRYGGNNVDIDQEMVNNAANSLVYDTSSLILDSKYTGLENVIRGGR